MRSSEPQFLPLNLQVSRLTDLLYLLSYFVSLLLTLVMQASMSAVTQTPLPLHEPVPVEDPVSLFEDDSLSSAAVASVGTEYPSEDLVGQLQTNSMALHNLLHYPRMLSNSYNNEKPGTLATGVSTATLFPDAQDASMADIEVSLMKRQHYNSSVQEYGRRTKDFEMVSASSSSQETATPLQKDVMVRDGKQEIGMLRNLGESTSTLVASDSVEMNVAAKSAETVDSSVSRTVLFPNAFWMLAVVCTCTLDRTPQPEGHVDPRAVADLYSVQSATPVAPALKSEATVAPNGIRHGISRYAPYGTRFGAQMRDNTFKTSHIAGDLANRARLRGGRGARVDLVLVIHDGETQQLESAWAHCEKASSLGLPRPGPSDVLNFLRDSDIDFDYRKGGGVRLYYSSYFSLQRNASNFYKRMLDYGRKINPTAIQQQPPIVEKRFSLMDLDLSAFADPAYPLEPYTAPTAQVSQQAISYTYDVALNADAYSTDDEYQMDIDIISEEDYDMDDDTDQTFSPIKRQANDNTTSSQSASWSQRQVKGISNKGLSRHSPYGTRFCAEMEDQTFRESFLAGDLVDRARVRGGKNRGELRLILHPGEISQLEKSWEFICSAPVLPGAASVLEHLRSLGMDINHRKVGAKLLQKNAGNFFKRVQEFGKRRITDPTYLRSI
jgi:hypothetical protein